MYKCKCGETDPKKFYGHKKQICAKCHNIYTRKKGVENRNYVLEKLGKCCSRCGYDEFLVSLDVHHLDPSKKDKGYKHFRGWAKQRIDKEIEGCILLCRNCHHALHFGGD